MSLQIKKSLENITPYRSERRHVNQEGWIFADWNEFLFSSSPKVLMEIKQFVDIAKYPIDNSEQLIELLCDYTHCEKSNISIYSGSDDALKDIFNTYLDHKKSAIIFQPTYSQVESLILANTNNLLISKIVRPTEEHIYNFEDIERADVVYLVHPNNPTGKLLEKSKVENLINIYENKLFIIDEAYYEYSGDTFSDLINKYQNLIITRTFSKAFGLAGLRIGYVLTNKQIIQNLNKVKNIKSVNSIATLAAINALKDFHYYKACIQKVKDSKDLFYSKNKDYKKLKVFQSSGNFVLIKSDNSEELIKFLNSKKILVRDRSNMPGLKNCIRVTIGNINDSKKIINSFDDYELLWKYLSLVSVN